MCMFGRGGMGGRAVSLKLRSKLELRVLKLWNVYSYTERITRRYKCSCAYEKMKRKYSMYNIMGLVRTSTIQAKSMKRNEDYLVAFCPKFGTALGAEVGISRIHPAFMYLSICTRVTY